MIEDGVEVTRKLVRSLSGGGSPHSSEGGATGRQVRNSSAGSNSRRTTQGTEMMDASSKRWEMSKNDYGVGVESIDRVNQEIYEGNFQQQQQDQYRSQNGTHKQQQQQHQNQQEHMQGDNDVTRAQKIEHGAMNPRAQDIDEEDNVSTSSMGSGVLWLLDTFCAENSILEAPNAERALNNNISISLDALDNPGISNTNLPQSLPNLFAPYKLQQEGGRKIEGISTPKIGTTRVSTASVMSPSQQRNLLNSPYHLHRRQKARLEKEKLKPKLTPTGNILADNVRRMFTVESRGPWSNEQPTAMLFQDIKKESKHRKLLRKMEKSAFAHASEIIIASASKNSDFDSLMQNEKNLQRFSVGQQDDPNNQIQRNIENAATLVQGKEQLTIGLADDSLRQNAGSLHPESPIQSDMSLTLNDHDPLYRIMCHESERVFYRRGLITKFKKHEAEKIASTDESRRVVAELMATSIQVIRSNEIAKLKSFLILPSRMWVTARVTYFLIVCYATMVKDGTVIEGPSPLHLKSQLLPDMQDQIQQSFDSSSQGTLKLERPNTSNKGKEKKKIPSNEKEKDKFIKKKGKRMFDGKEDFITAIKTIGLNDKYPDPPRLPRVDNFAHKSCSDEEYREILQEKVDMATFWRSVMKECDLNGINVDNALDLFSWELLKSLMNMKDEFTYALQMIEEGGAFDDDELQKDFYSRFPEDRLHSLREAIRHQSFNPIALATLNPPAARLCAWARRIVAGIYSVKQASMRIPLTAEHVGVPISGVPDRLKLSDDVGISFDGSDALGEKSSFVSASTATSRSLLAKLNIGANTNIQRLEQVVAYRPMPNASQSQTHMSRIVVCVDGSTSTHSSFLIAMALGKPLDCIDVIAVRKPNIYGGGIGGPAALSNLRSHYQTLVHNFSNSPSHRVFLPHELTIASSATASTRKAKSATVSFSSVISHDKLDPTHSDPFDIPEQHNLPPPAISTYSNSLINAAQEAEGIEGIILRSITTSADMCVIGMGWGRGLMTSECIARISSAMNARVKPLAITLASQLTPHTFSPILGVASTDKPIYKENTTSFAPSRFVICIKNSASSRAAFQYVRSLAKPCDLVFLVHLSVSYSNRSADPANIAHSLVSEYKNLGHNLHVEPLTLTSGLSRLQRRRIIAAQLRRTAAVFEPTFVVLGSSPNAAHKIMCGSCLGDAFGPATESRDAQPGASFLEEDSDKGNTTMSESLIEEIVVGGGGIEDLHALAPPPFSYILMVQNNGK